MKIRKVILLVFMLLGLGFISMTTIAYVNYRSHVIERDLSDDFLRFVIDIRNQSGMISISDYLDFECDGFYVVGPYMTTELREKLVKKKWTIETSMVDHYFVEWAFAGDNISEAEQLLIFVNDEKPVAFARLNRSEGDFVLSSKDYYESNDILYSDVEVIGSDYWKIFQQIE